MSWQEELAGILLDLAPDAFERLCQRLLRELGFAEVKVTGKAGDGGIYGFGMVRIAGIISLPVVFQCKRYRSAVGPGIVRDFRGAMGGRADRGVILTTSVFTREAEREATRDGVAHIDLIDGESLIEKLRETGLGVRAVEGAEVDPEFFQSL